MNKFNKIITFFICTITILQMYIYITKNTISDEAVLVSVNVDDIKKDFTIEEIDLELSKIKKLKINDQYYIDGKWKCNVIISGNALEVKEAIENLSDFKVLKYIISGNGQNLDVNLEIIR